MATFVVIFTTLQLMAIFLNIPAYLSDMEEVEKDNYFKKPFPFIHWMITNIRDSSMNILGKLVIGGIWFFASISSIIILETINLFIWLFTTDIVIPTFFKKTNKQEINETIKNIMSLITVYDQIIEEYSNKQISTTKLKEEKEKLLITINKLQSEMHPLELEIFKNF